MGSLSVAHGPLLLAAAWPKASLCNPWGDVPSLLQQLCGLGASLPSGPNYPRSCTSQALSGTELCVIVPTRGLDGRELSRLRCAIS